MEKENYTIQNNKTSAVVSCLGGTITRFNVGNTEVFYPLRAVGNKSRGGCHYCAPWFGNSSMGDKKHGHLRDLNVQKALNIQNTNVEFDFENPQSEKYPWNIHYKTTAKICDNGALKIELEMRNVGDNKNGPAPISPGLHPYFSCKDPNDVCVITSGERISSISECKMVFMDVPTILIQMPDKKIEMTLGGAFMNEWGSNIVLWTDSKEYVCVEPVLGNPHALNTPGGYFLKKGESIAISASFRLL